MEEIKEWLEKEKEDLQKSIDVVLEKSSGQEKEILILMKEMTKCIKIKEAK